MRRGRVNRHQAPLIITEGVVQAELAEAHSLRQPSRGVGPIKSDARMDTPTARAIARRLRKDGVRGRVGIARDVEHGPDCRGTNGRQIPGKHKDITLGLLQGGEHPASRTSARMVLLKEEITSRCDGRIADAEHGHASAEDRTKRLDRTIDQPTVAHLSLQLVASEAAASTTDEHDGLNQGQAASLGHRGRTHGVFLRRGLGP